MSEFDLKSDDGFDFRQLVEVVEWHRDHGLQVQLAHAPGAVTLNGSASAFIAQLLQLAAIGSLTLVNARAGDRAAQAIALRAAQEWQGILS